jgi:predicted transcriptional regulator
MPNIVPSPDFDNTPDFYIEGKHARMSQKKTASFLTVSQPAVSQWIVRYKQHNPEEAESILLKGFTGKNLNDIIGYYATSKNVKEATREHCVKLLIESSIDGFQNSIDRMAGIVPEPEIQSSSITTSEMLLADIKGIFTGIRDDLRKSEEKANKYFQLSESHLKNMYNMYPSYFRMQDIHTGLSKFSTLEKLFKEVSEQLETTAIQRFYPLSHYLKEEGYDLRNGEKIAVSHLVSGWLKLSGKEMLKKSKEFHNATNQYPECSRPLIIFAVEMVLSER